MTCGGRREAGGGRTSLSPYHPITPSPSSSETGFEGWAILELMGHRRLGGHVSEARVAGAAFIRIDVPHPNDSTLFRATHFYSPAAVHSIMPTTREIACEIAGAAPAPVTHRTLPGIMATAPRSAHGPAREVLGGKGAADDIQDGEPEHTAARTGPG